ncbi:hypothetical protein [Cellulosimicrobium sp. I38E]|uniref:hypothetical protein n=1 Tax=Cellulosimicrobium sp. I38E TaxID=1393139 RepID=UPI0007B2557A|nr:hypothetical protein [Cellulosimicrobium sp. I38E]KZM78393.1 hypothetical protein A0J59_13770 [Cellulosimicrobium sp. I38E]
MNTRQTHSAPTTTLPTPGMPPRFERLRFIGAPADASAPGTGEQTPADPPKPAPPAGAPQPTGDGASPAQADTTDWKAEARKWETRAKENKDAADKLAEIEKSKLDAVELAQRERDEAQAELTGFKTREQVAKWKAQVSEETGVPAAALSGSTLEELQAHAEVLKPLIGSAPKGPVVPTEGTHTSTAPVTQLTDDDLKSMTPGQINQARREGRLNKLLGIR